MNMDKFYLTQSIGNVRLRRYFMSNLIHFYTLYLLVTTYIKLYKNGQDLLNIISMSFRIIFNSMTRQDVRQGDEEPTQ